MTAAVTRIMSPGCWPEVQPLKLGPAELDGGLGQDAPVSEQLEGDRLVGREVAIGECAPFVGLAELGPNRTHGGTPARRERGVSLSNSSRSPGRADDASTPGDVTTALPCQGSDRRNRK